jgi:hypothetical protein
VEYIITKPNRTSASGVARSQDEGELVLKTGRYEAVINRADGTLKDIELSFARPTASAQLQYMENNRRNAEIYSKMKHFGGDGQKYVASLFVTDELETIPTPLEATVVGILARSQEIDALQIEMRSLRNFGSRELPYSESNSAMANFLDKSPEFFSLLSARFEEALFNLPEIWKEIEAAHRDEVITDFDVYSYSYQADPNDSLSDSLKKRLLERREGLRSSGDLAEPILAIEQQLSDFRNVGAQLAYLVSIADPGRAKKLVTLLELATSYQSALRGDDESIADIQTLYLDYVFHRWRRND